MPVKKADKSSNQDPGSNSSSGKKMMVVIMDSSIGNCAELHKVLEEVGFDAFICNDLSSCVYVLKRDYAFGFALVAPTMDGRDGYMKTLRIICEEQNVPLEVIGRNTIEKIKRYGVHFAQQIAH